MRNISSYLYPNRIQLLADVAGFTTEYTNVYQRNVKIYQGVDNVLEFDIKNADQKRLDLSTLSTIEMHVMDSSGKEVATYSVTPMDIKGLATVTIPAADLVDLLPQFLRYSVTHVDGLTTQVLYADSRFGAVGTVELIGSAMPTTRKSLVYDRFSGEIDYMGHIINHTSVIATKFYEAIPTTELGLTIDYTRFVGTIYWEGTKDSTVSVNSFTNAVKTTILPTTDTPVTGSITASMIDITGYNYIRVSWMFPNISPYNTPIINTFGTVDKVTVSY